MSLKILYEDNHLIAVYKPAGILVQGDETNEVCLMDEVKKYLKEKYKKQGNVFLGLLHRLDRPVSGIVLFAKTSKGASRLSEQFRNHSVKKIYQALVEGIIPWKEKILIQYLKKDEQKNKVTVFEKEAPGSKYAELCAKVLKQGKNNTLVQIELKTGRSHQIRAQLSHAGYPIAGDVKYGAKNNLEDKSIALCATRLEFRLPTKEETKKITIQIPENWSEYLK